MSSGVSRLGLEDIDSNALDNFDSSLEYEFVVNDNGERVKMPKLTEADRELLKLMTSDLWNFVADDKLERNLQKAVELVSEDEETPVDYQLINKLGKLSNPRGKYVEMYEEETPRLNDISETVSIVSARNVDLNKFDSDVNVQFKKLPKGATVKSFNTYKL
jgi:hypothetical protein